jgi:hypothetical protein
MGGMHSTACQSIRLLYERNSLATTLQNVLGSGSGVGHQFALISDLRHMIFLKTHL